MSMIGGLSSKFFLLCAASMAAIVFSGFSAYSYKPQELDKKVKSFLENHQYQWRDMNVPEVDGQILYDIIIENGYTRALEIGTSTGHSGTWIAWALSRTGGKLITIEIDERRYAKALSNFKEAGLLEYIDTWLADAHDLVPKLEGPFDFVFIDADKEWYTNYAKAVIPKLETGGCIAAHNVHPSGKSRWGRRSGTSEYYEFMLEQEEFETSLLSESQAGISVSYKRK